jgi:hypothetical protein
MTDYDWANARPYKVKRTGIKAPSSNWSDIECPFCGQEVRAYWWSISGGGKRCLCGAKHNSAGMTAQPIRKVA